MAKPKQSFEEWKKAANTACIKKYHLDIDDLPDLVDAWVEYEAGTTPTRFAAKAIAACKGGAW